MNLEQQFLDEIEEYQQALARKPTGTFTDELMRDQFKRRMTEIDEKLRRVRGQQLDIRLTGETVETGRLGSRTLAAVLSRLQYSLTWTGYALKSGPGVETNPPADVLRSTAMDVLALAPGSFRLILEHPEPENEKQERISVEGEDLGGRAIETLLDLFDAAEQNRLSETAEETAQSLGKKPTRQIQRLMIQLSDNELATDFRWFSREPREVSLSAGAARDLKNWLSTVEEQITETEVLGTLLMGDAQSGRFKLQTDAGELYEGKGAPTLLDGTQLNRLYRATMSVRKETAGHVGTTAFHYTLLRLEQSILDG